MPASVRATIEDFLSYRRFAMVGVSRNPKDFSRILFKELQSRGYDMVGVNPGVDEVEGARCYERVVDIDPPVEGAILMIPGTVAAKVVHECAAAGVPRIWFYRSIGDGAVSQEALEACDEHHIAAVPGECPFMFLSGGNWIHGAHRFCRRLMGTLPE